jgi:hypothetical protein
MAVEGVEGAAVGHGANGRGAVFVLTAKPGLKGIPDELDGVPVVAHVTGKFFALRVASKPCGKGKNPVPCTPTPDPGPTTPPPTPEPSTDCTDTTAKCPRPVRIGVSTGHPGITAGTIGARVTDGTAVYALSNNHIYANSNNASSGDNVLQPGPYDGGVDPDDAIGTLFDFQPIKFDGTANAIDAAIALSSTGNLGNSTPSNGYGTPDSTTKTVGINEKVRKYGRTTGQTKGFVWVLNATVNVDYGTDGVALFENQIIFRGNGTFSAGGDSGSLIVTQKGSNRPVALLFAGSSQFTIGNPIDAALERFNVTVDGQ